MPIKIPSELPASKTLLSENIFLMDNERAIHQDIRPLKIAILNLMPTKVETETQLLRLIGNTPLQIEIELVQMASHTSKNTSSEHLLSFYKTFDEIKDKRFDGMIVTGAPVEQMEFEEVDYWKELCEIFDWAKTNVYSKFHICWGAQAGLYYHYGINKRPLLSKAFGVFRHECLAKKHPILQGFDEFFYVPHSRHTTVRREDIEKIPELEILTYSKEVGVHMVSDRDGRNIFVTGHSEYDRYTLKNEYLRDVNKGQDVAPPENYFSENKTYLEPQIYWRAHASLLFSNWVNHIVYQQTPYEFAR